MAIKISEMAADGSVGGGELIPVSDGGEAKRVSVDNIKDYTIDQIEDIAEGSALTTLDYVYILDESDGLLKPILLETIRQYVMDAMWDMDAEADPDTADVMTLKDGSTEKTMTLGTLRTFLSTTIQTATIEAIEALGIVTTTTTSDYVYILRSGELRRIDVDDIAQYATDIMWGKAAETSPDDDDILLLRDGAGDVEKTIALSDLVTYFTAEVVTASLDLTGLAAAANPPNSTDVFLVCTSGGTPGKYTFALLTAAIHGSFDTYVGSLSAAGAGSDTDTFYVLQAGGTAEREMTLAQLKTYIGTSVTGPGSATVGNIPLWDGVDSLEDGVGLSTAFDAGLDTEVPTTKAVRDEMDKIVYDATDINADLVDADEILVDDGGLGTTQAKSTMSRVWTYISDKIFALSAKTAPVGGDTVLIHDSEASNAPKKVTLTNLLAGAAGSVDDLDIDGATDIGAALEGTDLFVVDDGAGGTNRKSAISRIWDYILANFVVDQDLMTSDSAILVPTQQSVKAYVDTNVGVLGKYDATTVPGATDDSGEGYSVGSIWVNVTSNIAYVCVDATVDAAIWTSVTAAATGWLGDIADADWTTGSEVLSPLEGGDYLMVGDSGDSFNSKKTYVSRIFTYVWDVIKAASGKTTAVSTDIIPIQDSAAAYGNKSLTLANLKAFLDTEDTYDTLWVGAGAMIPSETLPAQAKTVEIGSITYDVMAFDGVGDSDENAEFNLVMPPSWDRGTVKAKVYWTTGDSAANLGEWVEFELAAGALAEDTILSTALGTAVNIADQALDDNDLHITAASSALTIDGSPALGELIRFKLTRDSDHSGGAPGAMDVDAYVLGVLIQYKKDKAVTAW